MVPLEPIKCIQHLVFNSLAVIYRRIAELLPILTNRVKIRINRKFAQKFIILMNTEVIEKLTSKAKQISEKSRVRCMKNVSRRNSGRY